MYSIEEEKALKKEFWGGFSAFCETLPRFKYRKKKWILYHTKIKGVEMKFDATRDGAYVIFELNHPNEDVRLEMLALMERCKNAFVDKYFPDAIWEILYIKPCGTPVSRIYKHKEGLDIHTREQWPEFYPFLSKEMNQLEKMFNEMKDVLEEIR